MVLKQKKNILEITPEGDVLVKTTIIKILEPVSKNMTLFHHIC